MRPAIAMLAVTALGCASTGSPAAPDDAGDDAADVAVDTRPDSGCPAPAKITPAESPKVGFLAAVTVTLIKDVDGDTAHFLFPEGDRDVRFLWVNTEETTGTSATAFGALCKTAVAGWLTAAKQLVVTLAEDSTTKGKPALDPYGRFLGMVFVDGELLETRLVREGWSPYMAAFGCAPEPIHSALLHAEAEAWASKLGIWAPGHPRDYKAVVNEWVGTKKCRPNPYLAPYCK